MNETNQSYLATEEVGRLMGKYAVPCIIWKLHFTCCIEQPYSLYHLSDL